MGSPKTNPIAQPGIPKQETHNCSQPLHKMTPSPPILIDGTPPSPHRATQNPNSQNPIKKKKSRANILIATLNMRGRASPDLGNSTISKWSAIQHIMRKKIGVLCLQEMHLMNEHETQIESLYSRRLRVLNSGDPFRPGNSAGVAFVLNKEIINTTNAEITEIIPGRVIAINITWHNNKHITILNIYAPNDLTKHPNFWDMISVTVRLGPIHFPLSLTIVLHHDRLLPPSLNDRYLLSWIAYLFLAHACLIRRLSFDFVPALKPLLDSL
jgi:hypothetical protein